MYWLITDIYYMLSINKFQNDFSHHAFIFNVTCDWLINLECNNKPIEILNYILHMICIIN